MIKVWIHLWVLVPKWNPKEKEKEKNRTLSYLRKCHDNGRIVTGHPVCICAHSTGMETITIFTSSGRQKTNYCGPRRVGGSWNALTPPGDRIGRRSSGYAADARQSFAGRFFFSLRFLCSVRHAAAALLSRRTRRFSRYRCPVRRFCGKAPVFQERFVIRQRQRGELLAAHLTRTTRAQHGRKPSSFSPDLRSHQRLWYSTELWVIFHFFFSQSFGNVQRGARSRFVHAKRNVYIHGI